MNACMVYYKTGKFTIYLVNDSTCVSAVDVPIDSVTKSIKHYLKYDNIDSDTYPNRPDLISNYNTKNALSDVDGICCMIITDTQVSLYLDAIPLKYKYVFNDLITSRMALYIDRLSFNDIRL